MESGSPEVERLAAAMALDRLRFFGPQKARELGAAGLHPLDVLQDPSRLTIGGTRLQSFRAELARTATGKLQKFKLRSPYWEGHTRQVN